MSIFTLTPEEVEDIENTEELKCFPEDQDVTIRIVQLMKDKETEEIVRENKDGNPFFMVKLKVVGVSNAEDYKTFTHYIPLPSSEIKDAEARKQAQLKFKRFCAGFDIQIATEFELDDFIDKEADVILGIEEPKDGFDEKNFIKKYVGVSG